MSKQTPTLSIKAKSLMLEAKAIRSLELQHRRTRRELLRLDAQGDEVSVPFKLKDAIRSHERTMGSLKAHRKGIVAYEARMANLLIGIARGTPYANIEIKTDTPPDFKRLEERANSYFCPLHGRLSRDVTTAWIAAAKAHIKSQAESAG